MSTYLIQSCLPTVPHSVLHLILSYLGESVKKIEQSFDRFALQQSCQSRNQHDLLKSRPLLIVYIHTQQQTESLNKALSLWDKIIGIKIQETKNKHGRASDPISQEHLFWLNYSSLIGSAMLGLFNHYQNIVIVNQHNGIEGVCYSKAERSMRHIKCMFTSPWNHIHGYKSVKGVGSAFIEHAALQSLKQQGINPDAQLPYCCLKCAIVHVDAIDTAQTFYTHLFFAKQENEETGMILTGENVVKFFRHFGGRAQWTSCVKT